MLDAKFEWDIFSCKYMPICSIILDNEWCFFCFCFFWLGWESTFRQMKNKLKVNFRTGNKIYNLYILFIWSEYRFNVARGNLKTLYKRWVFLLNQEAFKISKNLIVGLKAFHHLTSSKFFILINMECCCTQEP